MNSYFQKTGHSKVTKINQQQNDKVKILDELNFLKMRLKQIGYNGDCAYEKKLSNYYLETISRCEQKLLQIL